MKRFYVILACVAAAVGAGFFIKTGLSENSTGDAISAAPSAPPVLAGDAQSAHPAPAPQTSDTLTNRQLDVLLAQALTPSAKQIGDEDARGKLRKLINEDPLILHQLIGRYDKETNANARQLIVSLLSSVEKPEVLAFSKRLATSADMAQRQDGLGMMQNLSVDLAELHPIFLQILANEKTPALILLTLGALKPPVPVAENSSKEARAVDMAQQDAIVTQLQNLSKNIDPKIRLQSILQLAQWDKTDSSGEYWAQALADSSSQVRQAALTGIAQSGTQSDKVKTALINLANNLNEPADTKGSALQVLERFKMNEDEAKKLRQLRAQVFVR